MYKCTMYIGTLCIDFEVDIGDNLQILICVYLLVHMLELIYFQLFIIETSMKSRFNQVNQAF